MAITRDYILTRLRQEELDELATINIEAGQTDPVTLAIAAAEGEIEAHVAPGDLPADHAQRLRLALAVPLVYLRLATGVPDKHLKEQTWARDWLRSAAKGETGGGAVEIVRDPADNTVPNRSATRTSLRGL